MKSSKLINLLAIASILAIFYIFAGHGYLKFYFGGKARFLDLANSINKICNTTKTCPGVPDGWQPPLDKTEIVRKGAMIYYPGIQEGAEVSGADVKFDKFTLVYVFFAPDHWFEAQGGVGERVTSGWGSRDPLP